MDLQQIKKIAVIGAGTMGQGIAQLAAMAGYETVLIDVNADVLGKALSGIEMNLKSAIERGKLTESELPGIMGRLKTANDLLDAHADVVIEAIIERLDIKRDVFHKLAAINAPDAIFATNTSSIPITQIAAGIPNPERIVGMHFFNPAHIMKLVEVISGEQTATEVAETIRQLAEKMGKQAVMAADAPGFIVNRVARHYYVEGLKLLEEKVGTPELIDELLENAGFKMGPFKLMDLIGVNTNFDVTTSVWQQFHMDGKFRPSRIQKQKADAGFHGRKSGRGFYSY